MHFGFGNLKQEYRLDDHILTVSSEVKDLGIIITPDLKFSSHVSFLIKKAYSRMALIFKTFKSKDPNLLLRAYKVYIRPLLENSTTVWSPRLITNVKNLEKVQRKFTKRVLGYNTRLTYEERLTLFNLETLEFRRLIFDLSFVYKITHNLVDIPSDLFFVRNTSITRSTNSLNFIWNKTRLDCRKYFFINRIIKDWNALPNDVVSASNTSAFKNRLKAFLGK